MMNNNDLVTINGTPITVKMFRGKRVVTFKDVDAAHQRPDGTAKRNFNENKKHLNLDEDYFLVTRRELSTEIVHNNEPLKGNPNIEVVLLTEDGYLLLVKSFTDDLAWDVQRQLRNSYFQLQDIAPASNEVQAIQKDLSVVFAQVNNIENTLEEQMELLSSVMDNMTISTRQQEKIHEAGRKRINYLLGGCPLRWV